MKVNLYDLSRDLSALTGKEISRDEARLYRRRLARYHSIQEAACCRDLTPREIAEEKGIERRLRDLLGVRLAEFSGDPRGADVKLRTIEQMPLAEGYEWLVYHARDWGGNLICTI